MKRRVLYSIALPIWVFVGFMLAQVLALAIIWVMEWAGISIDSFNPIIFNSLASGVIYTLAILIVFGVPWFIKKRRTTKEDLGIQRMPEWMDIVWAPAGLIAYFILTSLVTVFAMYALPFIDYTQAQDTGFATVAAQFEYLLAFLSLVIIAPIAEEILFRGYLFGKLRKHGALWVAILITSALFAFVHLGWNANIALLQWNVALDVFALSIVLCMLRVITGTIWPSILLHMLKNGIAFYFLFVNPTLLSTLGG